MTNGKRERRAIHSRGANPQERSDAARSQTEREEQDERPIDDPARLAEEARAIVEKNAAEIRKQSLPIATEPPAVYRP